MTFPFEPVKTDEWLQRRRSFLMNLHSGIGMNLSVHGNTAIGAGDIVEVNLKSPLKNPEINKDDFYSGNFLITKIKHVFRVSNAKHEMSLTVMKDSIERKLPTGANDEPASGVQRNPDVLGGKDKRTPEQKRAPKMPTNTVGTPEKANQLVNSMGFGLDDWDTYRNTLAAIESGGKYDIAGGSNNHYDGRYQLGRDAKTDASKQLGVSNPGHDSASRESYRNNPQMQENYLAGYTKANHNYLMKNPKYASASPQRKLQVLGYAHNQGMGGANKWLDTGRVGSDGFGTKGTKYSQNLAAAFNKKRTIIS